MSCGLLPSSNSSTDGGSDGGGSPAWVLEQLAARAAAARAAGGGGDEDELQALRLEARDAVEALLARMRDVASHRRSALTSLRRLAVLGDDGGPRRTPLLRQLAGACGAAGSWSSAGL